MRRGTRVGQAYVALAVDGSGVNEEIVHSVDEAGPGVEKAGDEHGQRYGDHFSDGFFSRLRDRLRNRGEDGALGFGNRAGSSEGAKIGDRLAKSLLEKIDNLGPETSARLRSMLVEVERTSQAAERALTRVENDNGKSPTRLANLTHAARTAENAATRMERAWRAALQAEGLLDAAVSRNRGGSRKNNNGLTGLDEKLLGMNFRNNFLNVIPKIMGGVVRAFDFAGSAVKRFTDNMGKAEEGASLLQKISAGFGTQGAEGAGMFSKALSSIAASGPGAAVAVIAVAVGASLLVSVLNALLAIVVALVSTIASALVGALAVGAGAFAALGAAAGLTVLAFMSMDNAQKKMLATSFRPLHQEAIGLGQTMLRDLTPAFATWSRNLQVALALATPLANVMGGALARAGDMLSASLSGPGVRMLIAALTVTLPGIVTHLSGAIGGFINGLSAMFGALMPYVLQFAVYLERVAASFAKWATSAQGQNAIVDFVSRALASLQSLWNFLGALGGLLAAIFFSPEAQGAGNNIFDSMAAALRRFTAYIQKDNRMQKWFAEGVVFAQALGQTIVTITQALQTLNQSGVIDGIASLASIGATAYSWFSRLPGVVKDLIWPLKGVADLIGFIGSAMGKGGGSKPGVIGTQSQIDSFNSTLLGPIASTGGASSSNNSAAQIKAQIDAMLANINSTTSSLQSSGATALSNTYQNAGGYLPNPKKPGKPKYKNPYVKWANSLIKQGPSISAQVKNAMLSMNKSAANGIAQAAKSTSAADVQSSMDSLMNSLTTGGAEGVNSAQSALNSAAQSLASATTKGAAKKALKGVKAAQRDLKAALDNQKRLNNAANILNAQKVVNESNISQLLQGILTSNATLADYAEARARVADMLNEANQKLTAAIALRDDYAKQVSESIKNFGSLLTAQAQTIDGVEQALTANDVTSNLQDKLNQMKHFQEDLRLLLAQGLSNDAYKQIVDAGVEQGTTFADALLSGGNAAIQNTNDLVNQINGIADSLGGETSSRLYQAGVDAAQGLVDGLTSLSAQLDSAAYQLGTSIANAVKAALGIASPSRVLRNMMTYVGDGIALGLDDQTVKVGTAATALSKQIAVTPPATYSSSAAAAAGVSGNGKPAAQVDLTIVTPTDDPHAVANEVINEVVGRLT